VSGTGRAGEAIVAEAKQIVTDALPFQVEVEVEV